LEATLKIIYTALPKESTPVQLRLRLVHRGFVTLPTFKKILIVGNSEEKIRDEFVEKFFEFIPELKSA
jgi:hypothetical protein